jgi:hypothetical protein
MRRPKILSLPPGARYAALRRLFLLVRREKKEVWRELVEAVKASKNAPEAAKVVRQWLETHGLAGQDDLALSAISHVLGTDLPDTKALSFLLAGAWGLLKVFPEEVDLRFNYTLDLKEGIPLNWHPLEVDKLIAWSAQDFTHKLRAWLEGLGFMQERPSDADADARLKALMLHLIDGASVSAIARRKEEQHDERVIRRWLAEAEAMTGLKRRSRTGRPSRK